MARPPTATRMRTPTFQGSSMRAKRSAIRVSTNRIERNLLATCRFLKLVINWLLMKASKLLKKKNPKRSWPGINCTFSWAALFVQEVFSVCTFFSWKKLAKICAKMLVKFSQIVGRIQKRYIFRQWRRWKRRDVFNGCRQKTSDFVLWKQCKLTFCDIKRYIKTVTFLAVWSLTSNITWLFYPEMFW